MKKLLLIEEDPVMSKNYTDRFVQAGYDLEVTVDGQTGLSALTRFSPDVVVLSHSLPDLTGIEMLDQIRSKPETRTLAVVVLTRDRADETLSTLRKAGANKCLIKERANDRELQQAVHDALAEASSPIPAVATEIAEPPTPAPIPPPLPTPTKTATPPPTPAPLLPSRPGASGQLRTEVEKLKNLAQSLLRAEDDSVRLFFVQQLHQEAKAVSPVIPAERAPLLGPLLDAFVALLKHLSSRPESIEASGMRTIFQTADFLGLLVEPTGQGSLIESGPYSVLAVDDEEMVRELVLRALATVHLKAETAQNPLKALEFAKRQPYDLFILDVVMPEMNGFDLCEKLRALPAHAKTPVIFVTGCNDFEHRVRFAQTRANDFIAKPFLLAELALKALRHLLESRLRQAQAAGANPEIFRSFER